jgi:hypothetical protein
MLYLPSTMEKGEKGNAKGVFAGGSFFFISVVVSGRSGKFAFACESVILHPDFLGVHVFVSSLLSLQAAFACRLLFARSSCAVDFISSPVA